jgi:hypothetical protein
MGAEIRPRGRQSDPPGPAWQPDRGNLVSGRPMLPAVGEASTNVTVPRGEITTNLTLDCAVGFENFGPKGDSARGRFNQMSAASARFGGTATFITFDLATNGRA